MTVKKITKSMKYKIRYNKVLYEVLKDIQYNTWKLKNETVARVWDWQQFSFSYKSKFDIYPKANELLGKRLDSHIYAELQEKYGENMASLTYDATITEVVKKIQEQFKKGSKFNRGEETLVTYKRNGSFPIRVKQIKNIEKIDNKKFNAKLSLLSRNGAKNLKEKIEEHNSKKENEKIKPNFEIKTQIPVVLSSGGSATKILERIIDGEYKLSDSRITQDKKGAFYLSIVYQFEAEKKELDKDKIMGIDVGVNVPAMLAISDNKFYKQRVGDGQEILAFQNQMNNRKRRLQQSRKWAGKGSTGHGVKTRIKPLEKLSGKIARFKDHKNHVWSRYIVDEAIRNNCGVIQMEDLTNISSDSAFLKTWSYYDLQQKIKYKAEAESIEVVSINPKYTSQRCNRCGNINKENRNVKENGQDKFKCMTCNHEENADLNAARNIAMKDIGEIIKEQIKLQKKQLKHDMKYIAE